MKNRTLRRLLYAVLIIFCAITLLPFYIMLVGSFKTQKEIMNEPYSIPGKVTLSKNLRWIYVRDETIVKEEEFAREFGLELPIPTNSKIRELATSPEHQDAMFEYIGARVRIGNLAMAIKRGNLIRNLIASFLVMLLSVFVLSLFGGMAGFSLAKLRFPSFSLILAYFLIGMALPRMLALIPLYKMMLNLKLLNNPLSLVLIYGASRMSITIIVFSAFYKSIPQDLEDAAAIDGLNKIGFFFRILLKMSHIPILTVFIVSGTFIYNDYLTPLIFMNDLTFTTVQVALSQFIGAQTWFFGPIFAGCLVAIVPMVLIYLLMNRYFISGVTAGAVKG
jgi:raffinose/stachyose/melibiose transport system permease protein